jgi:hypothetical protein
MIKTAGTTLNYIFRNSYRYNYVGVNNYFTPKRLKKLLNFNKNIKVISGHSLRSTDRYESVHNSIKYITFFRNPIDRYLSHYHHSKIHNQENVSLEERLQNIGENDYQTKFILGAKNIQERSFKAGPKELEKAKDIIRHDYSFIGLVEKFDESLVLLQKLLNIEKLDIRYQKKNVNKKKECEDYYCLKNNITEANKIDIELYDFINSEIFCNQINNYGKRFSFD